MRPLVSVIMPTYKGARFIERSIRSVLLQTMPNLELIIIDDGTPDNTEQIVKQFDDSRIVFIKKTKPRSSSDEHPRNVGMRVARGRYFCYLDHDDAYRLKFLEIMSTYLDEHPDVGLAFCDFIWHRKRRNPNGKIIDVAQRQICIDFDIKRLQRRNIIGILTVMHRQEIIDKVGYFKRGLNPPGVLFPKMPNDWDYWVRIARHFKIVRLPIVLADYIPRSSRYHWDKDFAPWETE